MSDFDENGFLSGRIETWIQSHQTEFKTFFEQAYEVNRYCHRFLDNRPVDLGNKKQMVSVVLFARLMEIYQSIIICISKGLITPSKILFRSLIETEFHFLAIHRDPNYLNEYLDQHQVQRRIFTNKINRSTSELLKSFREAITDELLEEIQNSVDELNAKSIKIEEVSKKAGCHEIYLTVYAILSREVHSNPSALDQYVSVNEKTQEIQEFIYGPSSEETVRVIGLSSLWICDALMYTSKEFGEDLTELCETQKEKFREFLEA